MVIIDTSIISILVYIHYYYIIIIKISGSLSGLIITIHMMFELAAVCKDGIGIIDNSIIKILFHNIVDSTVESITHNVISECIV